MWESLHITVVYEILFVTQNVGKPMQMKFVEIPES